MIQQQAAAARLAGAGGIGGSAAPEVGTGKEAAALMDPSEPVTAESTEDLQEGASGHHGGILQVSHLVPLGWQQIWICRSAGSCRHCPSSL
jgi:hypothetical protein